MSHPRKVLLISYFYPPMNATACVRTGPIAKYLSKLGWKVTVVTPNPQLWRVSAIDPCAQSDASEEGIELLYTNHGWRSLSPGYLKCADHGVRGLGGKLARGIARYAGIDRAVGWIGPVKKACEAIERKDVDLIVASGEPGVSFNLAQLLSKKIGCPYVLDYHDLLTGNPFASPRFARRVEQRERELVSMSSAITVVSQSWANDLVSRFDPVSKVHVIPNGYDSDLLDSIEPEKFDHPAIVYAGCFYPPKSVITPVMAALKHCDQDDALSGRPWQFHYYGRDGEHVSREAARFGLGRRVVIHGMLERRKAIAAVKGADACIVITSVCESLSPGDRGFITSKLYETLGAGTPIVLITPEGSEAHVMSKSYSHIARFTGDDVLGMARYFKTLITSGVQKATAASEYSWARITEDLDTILQGVIESSAKK